MNATNINYNIVNGKDGTVILYLNGIFNGTYDNFKEAYHELVYLVSKQKGKN